MLLFSDVFLANAYVASVFYEAWSIINTIVISTNLLSAPTMNSTNVYFVGGWDGSVSLSARPSVSEECVACPLHFNRHYYSDLHLKIIATHKR